MEKWTFLKINDDDDDDDDEEDFKCIVKVENSMK